MKQKLGKWTLLLALFCLTGCGTAKQPSTTVNPQTTPAPAEPSPAVSTDPLLSPEIPEEADRTLVVYFSATGNTKPLAEVLAKHQNKPQIRRPARSDDSLAAIGKNRHSSPTEYRQTADHFP